ncbi:hypothetical protein CsatB_025812 [Cannabis sativa]|uniref:Uncharacterized protein n=1 Tax=Cannabis sativa TaxID=3483 RepID=A0A803Q4V9_CANSA
MEQIGKRYPNHDDDHYRGSHYYNMKPSTVHHHQQPCVANYKGPYVKTVIAPTEVAEVKGYVTHYQLNPQLHHKVVYKV